MRSGFGPSRFPALIAVAEFVELEAREVNFQKINLKRLISF